MKTLELNLQKRLLIVEPAENEEIVYLMTNAYAIKYDGKELYTHLDNKNELKLICKGSELTEQIAKTFSREVRALNPVDGTYSTCYPLAGRVINATRKALESFKSLLFDQGYYWGKHPYEQPIHTNYDKENDFYSDLEYCKEAESKTFNPEKSLIFEIL